jgi:hypothetical protein
MVDERGNDPRRPGVEDGEPGDLSRPLASEAMPVSVTCPFCDDTDTEQFSAFGSALSVSQYYCRRCRTVFEWMKWRREGDG